MRKLFGFAFVRITNKDQIVVKDDTHGLCVFKVSSGFYQNHFAMFIENLNGVLVFKHVQKTKAKIGSFRKLLLSVSAFVKSYCKTF